MLKQKTTWAGLASIISAVGLAIATKDVASAMTGVMTGLGLIFAGDSRPQ